MIAVDMTAVQGVEQPKILDKIEVTEEVSVPIGIQFNQITGQFEEPGKILNTKKDPFKKSN